MRSDIGSFTAATAISAPVRVDADVLAGLWELADLAPLHQAKSLRALEAVSDAAARPPRGRVL